MLTFKEVCPCEAKTLVKFKTILEDDHVMLGLQGTTSGGFFEITLRILCDKKT